MLFFGGVETLRTTPKPRKRGGLTIYDTAQEMYNKLGVGAVAACALSAAGCAGSLVTPGGQVFAAGACPASMPFCELAAASLVAGTGTGLLNGVLKNEMQKGELQLPLRSNGPVFKTTKEASAKAEELGFEKIKERVNGQPVYRKGNEYITRDVDGHNGGAWKKAKSVKDLPKKETRSGTYDSDLNRIGD